ncbi:MAG: hypothetical protein D6743_13765, partial [Calditrichaeota bacterium]
MKQTMLILAMLLVAMPAAAQEVTEETRALVDGLYDRVDQLTAQVNELEAKAGKHGNQEAKKKSWTDKVMFKGKSYLSYSVLAAGKSGGADLTSHSNGFDVARVYLTMKAKPTSW